MTRARYFIKALNLETEIEKLDSLRTPLEQASVGDLAAEVAARDAAIAAAVVGLFDYQGALACVGNPNYPAASKGDVYIVSSTGKVGGASGVSVDIGDMIVAKADNAGGTQVAVGTSWSLFEHNFTAVSAGPVMIDQSATSIDHTGTQSNTTIKTIAVPPGVVHQHGVIEFGFLLSPTNNANEKNFSIHIGDGGDISERVFHYVNLANQGSCFVTRFLMARDANTIIGPYSRDGKNGGLAEGVTQAGAVITADLAAGFNIDVKCQLWDDASDHLVIEGYFIRVTNP